MILKIENLSKRYMIGNNRFFDALNNVSLKFDHNCLIGICGSSGSGKSTLLNLIAKIDRPSYGDVLLNKRSIYKNKINNKIFRQKISILFQSYNLIEDESILHNVMMPLLIANYKTKDAKEKSIKCLELVNISKELFEQKASKLSGGEKQRVSLARSLVIEPDILLCDEPTGALDSMNSEIVMKLLKKAANKCLVIIVSHNLPLLEKYSNRIITMKDGEVWSDIAYDIPHLNENHSIEIQNKHNSWKNKIAFKNYKNRKSRNILSFLGVCVGSISLLISLGFLNGKIQTSNSFYLNLFDYGVGTVSKQEKISSGSLLSLTKESRPAIEELTQNEKLKEIFEICVNYDALINPKINISYDGEEITTLNYSPIYSFESESINKELLVCGNLPISDTLNEVIINKYAYYELKKILNKDPLNEELRIQHSVETAYADDTNETIKDLFNYEQIVKIVGVVNETAYLSSNKIYYSFTALDKMMSDYIVDNLSTYFNKLISWKDRIIMADNSAPISAYSYRFFIKKFFKYNFADIFNSTGLIYTSPSLTIEQSLLSFLDIASFGIKTFLVVTLIGLALILIIISYANYSDDHKKSAILSCLGASNKDIVQIYFKENIINALIGILLSVPFSLLLSIFLNNYLNNLLDTKGLISIPFSCLGSIPYGLEFLLIGFSLILTFVSSIVPILLSKKINIKDELQTI